MPEQPQDIPFEKGLKKLEGIVKQLESAEIPLEQSLKLFEEGVQLSQRLRKQLDAAESKVEILTKKGSARQPEPYARDGDDVPF